MAENNYVGSGVAETMKKEKFDKEDDCCEKFNLMKKMTGVFLGGGRGYEGWEGNLFF